MTTPWTPPATRYTPCWGRTGLGTCICQILFTFVVMTTQATIPAASPAGPVGVLVADLHLSEKSYLCHNQPKRYGL